MDRLASNFLSNGDVTNASSLYNSLETLNPTKYSRMARICRVLLNPQNVPLPFRYEDICDALLEPSVPSEMLVRDSVEAVQKSYQRLAVCAHPDKNPDPRATDAFLRLTHMKEQAVHVVQDRGDGSARRSFVAGTAGGTSSATTGAGTGQRGAGAGKPTPKSNSFEQLRNTPIRLNCLKRRNISNDFEIFSSTQRTTTGEPGSHASSSAAILEENEEPRLASTVPAMAPRRPSTFNPRRQPPLRPPPKSAPTPANAKVKVASSTRSQPGTPVLAPVLTPSPPPSVPRRGSNTNSNAMPEPSVELTHPSEPAPAKAMSFRDAIKSRIDETCMQLQSMRQTNTQVQLKLDLSFDAYQRSKQAAAEATSESN